MAHPRLRRRPTHRNLHHPRGRHQLKADLVPSPSTFGHQTATGSITRSRRRQAIADLSRVAHLLAQLTATRRADRRIFTSPSHKPASRKPRNYAAKRAKRISPTRVRIPHPPLSFSLENTGIALADRRAPDRQAHLRRGDGDLSLDEVRKVAERSRVEACRA